MATLQRKAHFLGAKIRALRKRNGLTLEDLSLRCSRLDARRAPSVSYLSQIETGRRTPSEPLLGLLARVFEREPAWFLDDNIEPGLVGRGGSARGGRGMALEPAFLFSKDLMERALPELLSQTGTSGRQFAHVLIRAYQERQRNEFPDLERAAEEVGGKRFPLSARDLLALGERHGLQLRWFRRDPFVTRDDAGREVKTLVRSFFDQPSTVWLNHLLEDEPRRLKYDLAGHLAHKVLHGGDGLKSIHATGGELGGSPLPHGERTEELRQEDVLHAWRDFECSFFAGALLCPRQPFRRFVTREGHDAHAGRKIELTPSVVLRRMTAVSPYRHWHYFDVYPPGFLRALYRSNGIPSPWGNMRMVTDPCRQWAVFRMLRNARARRPLAQLELLEDGDRALLFASIALRVRDGAGNPHVISAGVDLMPALESQGLDALELAGRLREACAASAGDATASAEAAGTLGQLSRILSIRWIADALDGPVRTICPRGAVCPRAKRCAGGASGRPPASRLEQIKREVLAEAGG